MKEQTINTTNKNNEAKTNKTREGCTQTQAARREQMSEEETMQRELELI